MVAAVCTVNDVLDGHVSLDLECLDRIYLNAYVPNLQVGGQVVGFLTQHLGNPIPSPAIFTKLGTAFRAAVERFAATHEIPVIRFAKDARKADVMRPYLMAATPPGVVAIGVAQEFQNVVCGWKRKTTTPGAVSFAFAKADRRVSVYYFYVLDRDFGPGFIKLCSYFPYPAKVWVNGHEWAKRQATTAGVAFTELANGFASCDDPAALQAICDRLGPADLQRFFDRWLARIPTPLGLADQAAGYWWELSMRQIEVSRTLVFDQPRRARGFFEALVADNLDLGRPDEVKLIFDRRIRKDTLGTFATKIVTRGVEVAVNVFYKHSRIKQYLKEGRALRIETVVNSPTDLGCQRRLRNLDQRQGKARAANRRLLTIQRVGQGCAMETALLARISQPSVEEGQRTGALRLGDPRVMALAGALCILLNTVVGFTNRSLRAQVSGLLGGAYSSAQMTYDLRRLRLKGLIQRIEHSNRYVLTPDGLRVAVFYTKLHHRLLGPLLAADRAPAPPDLRDALRVIDRRVNSYVQHARMGIAA
jgi:hypothetical protein